MIYIYKKTYIHTHQLLQDVNTALLMWHRRLKDYETTSRDQLELKIIFFSYFFTDSRKKSVWKSFILDRMKERCKVRYPPNRFR